MAAISSAYQRADFAAAALATASRCTTSETSRFSVQAQHASEHPCTQNVHTLPHTAGLAPGAPERHPSQVKISKDFQPTPAKMPTAHCLLQVSSTPDVRITFHRSRLVDQHCVLQVLGTGCVAARNYLLNLPIYGCPLHWTIARMTNKKSRSGTRRL